MAVDSIKFGKNVKSLREYLGLSQKSFGELLSISTRSIAYIEAGKSSLKRDMMNKFLEFFYIYNASDLGESIVIIPKDLKDKLIAYHKPKNEHFIRLLLLQPKIPHAIRYKLLPSTFFDKPRETNQIRIFFEQHGWVYDGDTLSKALCRSKTLLKITPHSRKSNTNLYSRLQQ